MTLSVPSRIWKLEAELAVCFNVVTMTISAGKIAGGATALDKARLRAFASSYMQNGHGALTVTAPSDAQGAADAVRAELDSVGVPVEAIALADYRGNGASASDVILSYTRYVATPSACGVWEGMRERDYRNMRTPNFGCATQNNLAAMIGDPHDLIAPADMTDPDAATRILKVTKFRKGEVTSTETDSEIETQVSK